MARTHEREIKKRLKQRGWTFARRDGGHDIYEHTDLGILTVSMGCSGRTLRDLYADIKNGPVSPNQRVDAQAKPITEPQLPRTLANRMGWKFDQAASMVHAKSPPIEYEGERYWLRRDRATDEQKAALRPGRRGGRLPTWLYYVEKAEPEGPAFAKVETVDTPRLLKDSTAALAAAEELLEEVSEEKNRLATKLGKQKKEYNTLQKAHARLKKEHEAKPSNAKRQKELGDLRMEIAELKESLDAQGDQLAVQHQELEALPSTLAEKDRRIEELQAKLKNTEHAYHELMRELEEKPRTEPSLTLDEQLLHAVNHLAVAPPERWAVEIAELRRVMLCRLLP